MRRLQMRSCAFQVPVYVLFESRRRKIRLARCGNNQEAAHLSSSACGSSCFVSLQVPVDVAIGADAAKSAWRAIAALGLHPHAWVRAASARLLGSAFAHPCVGAYSAQRQFSISFKCQTFLGATGHGNAQQMPRRGVSTWRMSPGAPLLVWYLLRTFFCCSY